MTTIRVSGATGAGAAPTIRLAGALGTASVPTTITLAGATGGFVPAAIPDGGVWFCPDGATQRPAELWLYVP